MQAEPVSAYLIVKPKGESWVPVTVALALSSGILFNGFNSAGGQAVSCIINCATLILLLLVRPLSLKRWKIALPVLSLIGLATVWAVFASGFPAIGPGALLPEPFAPDFLALGFLSQIGGIAALLCGVVIGGAHRSRATVVDALVILCCLYLIVGLIFRATGTEGVLSYWTVERDGRFQGTVGNVNVTAAVAGVVAILALSRLIAYLEDVGARQLIGAGLIRAALYCFALLVAMGTAFATASRFTNVLTVGLLIGLVLLCRRRGKRSLRGSRPVLIATAFILLLLLAQFTGLLVERFDTLGAGARQRQAMLEHYFSIAMLSPLYGYGWGSFPSINAHFPGTLQFAQASWSVNSAHNILLQLWLNAGVPYLLLIVGSFALGVRQVVLALNRCWTTDDIGIGMAALLIVACAMIDIALDVPATTTLGLLFTGMLWGRALVRLEVDRRKIGLLKIGIARSRSKGAQDERFISG
jgi:hypothetical protein